MPVSDDSTQILALKKSLPLYFALMAAGLAGNYLRYEIFFNIEFIFGSIFAICALQIFGFRWGVLAAFVISLMTFFIWNHPWAIVIMTFEVVAVGLLNERKKMDFVIADTLYWVCLGMPLVFLFYFFIMHLPVYNALVTMAKQALNGITNVLIARLVFMAIYSGRRKSFFTLRDIFFNLLAFSILATSLLLISTQSRREVTEMDLAIRGSLSKAAERTDRNLEKWLKSNVNLIHHLAQMAENSTAEKMQQSLEHIHVLEKDFLRIGLHDRNATTVAYSPLLDELGQSTVGKNFADRQFIQIMKRDLQPMLTEIEMGRVGIPKPRAAIVAPVVKDGQYSGYVYGALDLERLAETIALNAKGQIVKDLNFILLDNKGRIIVTNRTDLKVMDVYNRPSGEIILLAEGLYQWLPVSKKYISISERWKRSFYISEHTVGAPSEWKLILELPIAPVQQKIYEKYAQYLFEILFLLLAGLAVSRLLSRSITRSIESLSQISVTMSDDFTAVGSVTWPSSTMVESNLLIKNFRDMARKLAEQFRKVQEMNESLELKIEQRIAALRESEERLNMALSSAQQSWFDLNVQTGEVVISPEHALMLGYDPEEFSTSLNNWFENIYPDDCASVRKGYQECLAYGGPVTLEYRRRTKAGGWKWISSIGKIVAYDAEHKPLRMIGVHADITGRREVEEALRESEERFRSLFEKVHVIALVIDPENGAIVDANTAASAYYGWSREELLAKKISGINTLSQEDVRKEMEAAKTEQRSYFLFRHRRADESIRDVEVYSGPIQVGGKTLLYSIIHDITERRAAEEKILKLVNEQQTILNTIAVGVVYVRKRTITWGNPAFLKIFGYEPEETAGLDARMLYTNDADYERVGAEGYAIINAGGVYTTEVLSVKKDGNTFWLNLTGRAVNHANPEEGSIWMFQDVSEQKRLFADLELSEQYLRALVENATDAIFIHDFKGNIVDCNRRACENLGYSREELLAKKVFDVDPDFSPQRDVAAWDSLTEQGVMTIESRHMRRDGTLFPVEIRIGMLKLSSGDRAIAIARDISERKAAEDALKNKTHQLEDLTENLEKRVQEEMAIRIRNEQILIQQAKLAAMGEMLGAIAHQWRQPLNTLGMCVQNINDAFVHGDLNRAYLERAVQKSMDQIHHMSKTIDDFRNFFQPDKEKSTFDTMTAVGEVISLFSAQLTASDIAFRLTCHTHARVYEQVTDIKACPEKTVDGYKNEFEHVILNLISNAKDAINAKRETSQDGSSAQGLITFDFFNRNDNVVIEVGDNGTGIPETAMSRIFEPYFTMKEQSKGTGIGLYMSRIIIEDHMKGSLSAKNGSEGAIFTIILRQTEKAVAS